MALLSRESNKTEPMKPAPPAQPTKPATAPTTPTQTPAQQPHTAPSKQENKMSPTEVMAAARAARGRKPANKNETKEQKLVRLGQLRVEKLKQAIRKLSSLGAYGPTEQQTNAVFSFLKKQFELAEQRWRGSKKEDDEYTFPTGQATGTTPDQSKNVAA